MPILLVRHGDALASSGNDEHRALSARGRDETRALGGALVRHGLAPARIVSSPLVRAVQTAELIGVSLGHDGVIEVDDSLIPSGDSPRAVALLRAWSVKGLVLAVTHEPIVRAIAATLLRQATFPSFRTAGAVLIDHDRVVLRLDPDSP